MEEDANEMTADDLAAILAKYFECPLVTEYLIVANTIEEDGGTTTATAVSAGLAPWQVLGLAERGRALIDRRIDQHDSEMGY